MILDAEILEQATQYIATQMTCSFLFPFEIHHCEYGNITNAGNANKIW